MKSAAHFVERLAEVSFRSVFNPYRDACGQHDGPEAPAIRRANLLRYLEAIVDAGVDSIWLGRDCGYRGARRTGIALTDEIHLAMLQQHLGVTGITKATTGSPLKERTATEVWKVMQTVSVNVFLWNVFPTDARFDNDGVA